jgi:hypothetical protein
MAFLNPACSKASFQARTPLRMASRNSAGVVFSIYHTIGSTGSESFAPGSFYTRRQR